jgi:mono/diheme cytochrome c family protein
MSMRFCAAVRALFACAVPCFALGCGSSATTPTNGSSTGDTSPLTGTVDRGKYLVDHLLVCGECHTPSGADGKPDAGKYLAGSRSYDFPYMGHTVSVYAENLTSHATEGLGMWSDANVRRALTRGIDDENVAMWPIMPYPEYALLKPEDVDSIIKYLRTVPSNGNVVPPDDLPDPDAPPPPLTDNQIPHTTLAMSDPSYAAAERGRYLAAVGCVQCHTPATAPGIPDLSKAFAGGRQYQVRVNSNDPMPATFTSTNLTPDATGLGGWSVDDIVQSIKTNTEKGTHRSLCVTMPGGPGRMGDLTNDDLNDVATYLHNLAPIANGPFTCSGR